MLELLIGLADRMSFLMSDEKQPDKVGYFFWHLVLNLRLAKLKDDIYDELNGDFFVDEAVQRVLDRSYERDGNGGLFPLKRPSKNQRTVEIWYQMQAWLGEHCDIQLE